jgi:hypothetical protein
MKKEASASFGRQRRAIKPELSFHHRCGIATRAINT